MSLSSKNLLMNYDRFPNPMISVNQAVMELMLTQKDFEKVKFRANAGL
jgi:hypothetical protein